MRLHPKRWSVATKWSLLVMIIALAPLFAVIRFSYEQSADRLLAKSFQSLSKGAADSASSLEALVAERVRQARYLSSIPTVVEAALSGPVERPYFNARASADITPIIQAYPYLESVEILDHQGNLVYSNRGHSAPQPVLEPTLMETVKSNKVFVGRVEGGGASLVIAAPIGIGAQQGILRTQSTPHALVQRVASDNQRDGTVGILLDEGHVSVSRSDGLAPGELFTIDREQSLVTGPDGEVYYAQFARLNSLPWQYVMLLPVAQVQAERAEQQAQALLLAFGTALIIGGVARFLVLRFVRPITQLAVVTKSLSEGDLTFEVNSGRNEDEVGQLQTSFNEAHKQLRRLVARMRLSSHLVAEASEHLYGLTTRADGSTEAVTSASQKLAVVAKDLERQVAHFKI